MFSSKMTTLVWSGPTVTLFGYAFISIRGVRRGEGTVLNVQRKILPMAERLSAGKPELLKNVKARIAQLALKGLPRIAGVYPAAVCQALLECGLRQEKKKLLMQLTGSSRIGLRGSGGLGWDV
jgi:hypothetical protein